VAPLPAADGTVNCAETVVVLDTRDAVVDD